MPNNPSPERIEELARRCEAARSTDELAQLDWDIEEAIGEWVNLGGARLRHKTTGEERTGYAFPRGKYTSSLDAALTLLPDHEGVGWRMTDGAGGPTAEVWCFDFDTGKELFHVGAMPTAAPALALCALALCAAALRAAANTSGTGVPGEGD